MIGFLSITLFAFGLAFVILFFYSLSKQRNSLSAPFSIMCLAIAVYVIGYSLELQARNIEDIKFFLKMEYFGAPFMSAFWMLFAYKFHFKRKAHTAISILILIIPMLTLFFSVTNEYHHLIYADISTFQYDGHMLSLLTKGPWYYVNLLYAYLVQAFGVYVFFKAWRSSGYKGGTPSSWMFFGSFWPAVVNLIYMSGHSPLSIDLTPFGLSISAVFFYIALFRFDFLELKEIVKDVAFSEINEGIIVIDDKNRLIDFNKACQRIFDWLDLKNIGTDVTNFKEGREILDHKDDLFEMKLLNMDTQRYFEFRKTVLKEKNKNVGYVYFIQDISKQKEMIDVLNTMANYDSLTQVYNRRRLMEEAEKALLLSNRCLNHISFLMLDIDHFKLVNDRYGHLAGDEVLKMLAAVCKERIRRTDMIGRFGGEEFLIILPDTDSESAFTVASDIKGAVAEIETIYEHNIIKVTISIGIESVLADDSNTSVDKLINNADIALYKAKNSGRNRICIYEGGSP